MEVLAALFVVVLLVLFFMLIGDWIVHITMVKDKGIAWGWGDYSKFKREFEKADKAGLAHFHSFSKEGVFSHGWDSDRDIYVFANIIAFEGKGMIINNPISFFMTKLYTKEYIENNSPYSKTTQKESRVKW